MNTHVFNVYISFSCLYTGCTVLFSPFMTRDKRIICAVDTNDMNRAVDIILAVRDYVGAIKLGLEFFLKYGLSGVKELNRHQIPIFLDLKLHDIPNTVTSALEVIRDVDIFMTTIHVSGGVHMMQSAAEILKGTNVLLIGVTVLTSLNSNDLRMLGVDYNVLDISKKLSSLAFDNGLNGVICSAHEVRHLRQNFDKDFLLVTPGIQVAMVGNTDQKRVMTPEAAIENGADYMVIGRAITNAPDPSKAVRDIVASIQQSHEI